MAPIDLRESLEDADWTKRTLDFRATNADELREELGWLGVTVEQFRALPAFELALSSYSWLLDL